jgi:processive 1,2-diacylglycerol beta-glucosyltransferase
MTDPSERVRIAILTTRGGQGLISGSEAIREALLETARRRNLDVDVQIVEFFSRYSPVGAWLTSLYNLLLRRSLWLSAQYVRGLHRLRPDKWKIFYRTPLRGFARFLDDFEPHAIVLTSQYIVSFAAYALRETTSSPPLSFVANIDPGTSCVPLWFNDGIGTHLIPTPETMQAYLEYGFNPARAVPAKLVVRQRFLAARALERRKLRRELAWPEEGLIVLFAGSREGYHGVVPLVRKVWREAPPVHVAVLCGESTSLKKRLDRWTESSGADVVAFGWRNDVERLMRAADVVIAKPGKQTMKETIAVGAPLISIAFPSVMEQELGNLEFMENRGVLLRAEHANDVVSLLTRFRAEETRAAFSRQLDEARRDIEPAVVADLILDACNDRPRGS